MKHSPYSVDRKGLSTTAKTGLWVLAIVIIAAAYGLMHWQHDEHHHIEHQYPVFKPWRQTIETTQEYVAQIRSVQHIELRSFEKGYLQNIYVDEGQFVHKGQKMFQIMPLLAQAEFKKAEAEYELTRIEYKNTAALQKRNVVSANELALAKARLDKAKAEMDLANAHLDFTDIKAPFDGIMDKFHVRLGSLVDEGELLTTLSDNSNMWVYFNVSEADYLNFMAKKHAGSNVPVRLLLANGKVFEHEGTIDTIEADFNNETGNVAFRATFPNPEQLLRHGETGTVLLSETLEDALVIPQKATFEILDKKYVFLVNKEDEEDEEDEENKEKGEGKLLAKEVSIAQEVPHLFAIASGLSEDDTILLEGLGKVHSGMEIETSHQNHTEVLESLELHTD